jgi:arsenate reductase
MDFMMSHVICYHNPRCSKSRQTLALLDEKGITPTIILYLENPPSVQELTHILRLLNCSPQALMRKKDPIYFESGLNDLQLTQDEQIQRMIHFPAVIERPIVVYKEKAVIARPPEKVLTLF